MNKTTTKQPPITPSLIVIFCLIISSATIITGPLGTLCIRGLKVVNNAAPQTFARLYSVKIGPASAGKDLKAISDEENALVLKILSLKEIAYDIPEYGSPRNLNRKSCTLIPDYEKIEHELYQKLDQLRRMKRSTG